MSAPGRILIFTRYAGCSTYRARHGQFNASCTSSERGAVEVCAMKAFNIESPHNADFKGAGIKLECVKECSASGEKGSWFAERAS